MSGSITMFDDTGRRTRTPKIIRESVALYKKKTALLALPGEGYAYIQVYQTDVEGMVWFVQPGQASFITAEALREAGWEFDVQQLLLPLRGV